MVMARDTQGAPAGRGFGLGQFMRMMAMMQNPQFMQMMQGMGLRDPAQGIPFGDPNNPVFPQPGQQRDRQEPIRNPQRDPPEPIPGQQPRPIPTPQPIGPPPIAPQPTPENNPGVRPKEPIRPTPMDPAAGAIMNAIFQSGALGGGRDGGRRRIGLGNFARLMGPRIVGRS